MREKSFRKWIHSSLNWINMDCVVADKLQYSYHFLEYIKKVDDEKENIEVAQNH